MLLTVYQRYILDCLREIPYMSERHLQWLLRLKFDASAKKLEHNLHQLEYLRKIERHVDRGGFAALPKQKCNDCLLMAADIMAEVCGNSLPEFLRGEPPCLLSFYLQDARGYLDFKVVPVSLGAEQMALERLRRHYKNFKCTWLFLLESYEQIEKLHTENPACFIFRNKAGGYDFLRTQ